MQKMHSYLVDLTTGKGLLQHLSNIDRANVRESVLKWNHHLKGTSIQTQLNKQVGLEQKKNAHCLEIIFSSIEYLARQAYLCVDMMINGGIFFSLLNYEQMAVRTYKLGWSTEELTCHMKFKTKY